MPRAISDDELALLGREKAVGDVNRDALLTLRRQAIDKQREVNVLPLRADFLRVRVKRIELVLEDHLRIVQQASDQSGLAVIDTAAGDEAQQRLVLVLLKTGVDILGDQIVDNVTGFVGGRRIGHQKYPSCFFFSIPAPPASLSIARP